MVMMMRAQKPIGLTAGPFFRMTNSTAVQVKPFLSKIQFHVNTRLFTDDESRLLLYIYNDAKYA